MLLIIIVSNYDRIALMKYLNQIALKHVYFTLHSYLEIVQSVYEFPKEENNNI